MNREFEIFDRRAVRAHRDRAAAGLGGYDFLFRAAAEGLAGRLADIRRNFAAVLDLGCHDGFLAEYLEPEHGTELLVQCDLSEAMAGRAPGRRVAADEELLPFAPMSFDLVISCLTLHWVNDLPGCLVQARRALKPDGLFLAVILGGETLRELRSRPARRRYGTLRRRRPTGIAVRRRARCRRSAGPRRFRPAGRR